MSDVALLGSLSVSQKQAADHLFLVEQYNAYTFEYNLNYKSWGSGDMMTTKEFNMLWEWFRDCLAVNGKEGGILTHALVDKCAVNSLFADDDKHGIVTFFENMDTNGNGAISFFELLRMTDSSDQHMGKLRQHIRNLKGGRHFGKKGEEETSRKKYFSLPSNPSIITSVITTTTTNSTSTPTFSSSSSSSSSSYSSVSSISLPAIQSSICHGKKQKPTSTDRLTTETSSTTGTNNITKTGTSGTHRNKRLVPISAAKSNGRKLSCPSALKTIPPLHQLAPSTSAITTTGPFHSIRRAIRRQLSRLSSCEDIGNENGGDIDGKDTKVNDNAHTSDDDFVAATNPKKRKKEKKGKEVAKKKPPSKEKPTPPVLPAAIASTTQATTSSSLSSPPVKVMKDGNVLSSIRKSVSQKLSKLASFGDSKDEYISRSSSKQQPCDFFPEPSVISDDTDADVEIEESANGAECRGRVHGYLQRESSSSSIQSIDSFD
jgi:hypothetical protein